MNAPDPGHPSGSGSGGPSAPGGSDGSGSGRPAWLVPAALVVVLILVIGGYYLLSRDSSDSSDTAAAGGDPGGSATTECITIEESSSFSRRGRGGGGGAPEAVTVDCSSPEAQFAVLGERPAQSGIPYAEREVLCTDFPGATAEFQADGVDGPVMCLGPVGVDTASSINTIAPGECLVRDGDDPEDVDGSDDNPRRADCAEPGAMRVLAVLRGGARDLTNRFIDKIEDCEDAGVPQATEAFSWGLDEQEDFDHEKAVCLEPAQAAP
ncbi:LppU/SCO3897 family protein [Dietzia cercidiphylli]|uniref:LppU/SCO3897 family protein n=1 Tax=Dietzia cercidiphylli TaxID=498199 RepID=UPI00223B2043|nr:hypothetical protein [Dietzia cercidiphylli]MCT1515374.1 hypothetical protein [Dietzia cercidiphylli]